jgi:hypothetical protein
VNSQQNILSESPSRSSINSENTQTQEQRIRDFKKFMIQAQQNFNIASSSPESYDNYYPKLATKYKSRVYKPQDIESQYVALISKKLNKKEKRNWSEEEIIILIHLVRFYCTLHENEDALHMGHSQWQTIASYFPQRQADACKDKWLSLHQMHVHDSPWTEKEDQLLCDLIQKHGIKKWTLIAKDLSHQLKDLNVYRQAKQCRERWINHLDPTINKGLWDQAEDIKLLTEISRIGRRWSELAKLMINRTENSVKNRWKSLLKKYKADLGLSNISEANTTATERIIA